MTVINFKKVSLMFMIPRQVHVCRHLQVKCYWTLWYCNTATSQHWCITSGDFHMHTHTQFLFICFFMIKWKKGKPKPQNARSIPFFFCGQTLQFSHSLNFILSPFSLFFQNTHPHFHYLWFISAGSGHACSSLWTGGTPSIWDIHHLSPP